MFKYWSTIFLVYSLGGQAYAHNLKAIDHYDQWKEEHHFMPYNKDHTDAKDNKNPLARDPSAYINSNDRYAEDVKFLEFNQLLKTNKPFNDWRFESGKADLSFKGDNAFGGYKSPHLQRKFVADAFLQVVSGRGAYKPNRRIVKVEYWDNYAINLYNAGLTMEYYDHTQRLSNLLNIWGEDLSDQDNKDVWFQHRRKCYLAALAGYMGVSYIEQYDKDLASRMANVQYIKDLEQKRGGKLSTALRELNDVFQADEHKQLKEKLKQILMYDTGSKLKDLRTYITGAFKTPKDRGDAFGGDKDYNFMDLWVASIIDRYKDVLQNPNANWENTAKEWTEALTDYYNVVKEEKAKLEQSLKDFFGKKRLEAMQKEENDLDKEIATIYKNSKALEEGKKDKLKAIEGAGNPFEKALVAYKEAQLLAIVDPNDNKKMVYVSKDASQDDVVTIYKTLQKKKNLRAAHLVEAWKNSKESFEGFFKIFSKYINENYHHVSKYGGSLYKGMFSPDEHIKHFLENVLIGKGTSAYWMNANGWALAHFYRNAYEPGKLLTRKRFTPQKWLHLYEDFKGDDQGGLNRANQEIYVELGGVQGIKLTEAEKKKVDNLKPEEKLKGDISETVKKIQEGNLGAVEEGLHILGVEKIEYEKDGKLTEGVIKEAKDNLKILSLENHPDKQGDKKEELRKVAEEMMKNLNALRSALSGQLNK